MLRLMNAAVMPVEGTYTLKRITPPEFRHWVLDAKRRKKFQSYIGYPNCKIVLEELCGTEIPLNRESTPVEHGDTLLIARLIYRVENPGQVQATLADYEFFVCHYRNTVPSDEAALVLAALQGRTAPAAHVPPCWHNDN